LLFSLSLGWAILLALKIRSAPLTARLGGQYLLGGHGAIEGAKRFVNWR
jgi:hypothetical protein